MNEPGKRETIWVSGNDFVANQTEIIKRMYKSSRPRPRNRAMGFKGETRKKQCHDR